MPQTLPVNLGFVLYMPDPILNPTQVRVRFVDIDGPPAGEHGRGLPELREQPAKAADPKPDPAQGGATLQLPPIKAVPGSLLASNTCPSDPRPSRSRSRPA